MVFDAGNRCGGSWPARKIPSQSSIISTELQLQAIIYPHQGCDLFLDRWKQILLRCDPVEWSGSCPRTDGRRGGGCGSFSKNRYYPLRFAGILYLRKSAFHHGGGHCSLHPRRPVSDEVFPESEHLEILQRAQVPHLMLSRYPSTCSKETLSNTAGTACVAQGVRRVGCTRNYYSSYMSSRQTPPMSSKEQTPQSMRGNR